MGCWVLGSCPETPLQRLPSRSGFPPCCALGAAGGAFQEALPESAGRAAALHPTLSLPLQPWPYTPGAGASLLCQSGCAGPGQVVLLLFNPICLPKSLPMRPPMLGCPGLLPRIAAVPWGNPASATLWGGGNPHLQPEHYKQNSLPRWQG